MRDFKRLQSDPPQGVNGSPKSDSIMLWNAVIFGPDDTPWDGGKLACNFNMSHMHPCSVTHLQTVLCCAGTFKLTLEFSEEYPNKAPVVKFKSTMFHPNSEFMQCHSGLYCRFAASYVIVIAVIDNTLCHAVYADGGICLDILQNQWSPIYDVSAILTSIQVRFINLSCMMASSASNLVPSDRRFGLHAVFTM